MRPGEAEAIVAGTHGDPFAVLGVHREDKAIVARCYIPGAQDVAAFGLDGTPLGTLIPTGEGGLFAGQLKLVAPKPVRYHARNADGDWWVDDPYAYGPVLGPLDDHYIGEGTHLRLFDKLGAHLLHHEGSEGMHFAVWAPNARRVSVVGPFNQWNGRRHVMRLRRDTGIWEIFIPGVGTGEAYKFEILANNGTPLPLKADPFAFHAELRPYTASLTTAPLAHEWGDHEHRAFWAKADARRQPISIYEVHAGSWRRGWQGEFLTWDELADQLIPYVVDLGFTHIELMPITEHPYDPSWGYQTTGMFAPTSRFGDGEGFARFVDGCHRAGIGVILDWVPAHFPVDAFGLEHFDGTALYEHADPRQGFHPDWNTAIYNFGRSEVSAFLVNSALYWTETFHLDGLRVDAVASMLYLDYSRKSGEWVPNAQGGRENVDAVAFLQRMNAAVYGANPGVMTIAEESTSWPGVSKPVHEGGLGFGFKWNMGFMHDTLAYLARDPVHRRWHHDELLFGLVYAFDENFVLPLSHDEVVHGKGTLLTKMAGTYWQKFANLRAYYGFMWGYPGKKLLFMGQEFAQAAEWSEARGLDWHLLDQPAHDGVRGLVRDLNRVYRKHPALHARDCEGEGFAWIVADDRDNAVFAWVRQAPGETPVVVVTNFTPQVLTGYRITLPRAGTWCEILNTDAHVYGGSGVGNFGGIVAAEDGGAVMTIPPLATIMFEHNT